jgi:hypothetical protein
VREGRKGNRNDRTDTLMGREKGHKCSKGIKQKKNAVRHEGMKGIISPKRITCICTKSCHTEWTRTEHWLPQ